MNPMLIGGLMYAAPFAISLGYDKHNIARNRLTNVQSKGIVLVPETNISYTLAQRLMCERGRLSNFFTENEIKLDWKYRATSEDLMAAINNSEYQSIALMGPSKRDSWKASDREVSIRDISQFWNGEQKVGFWVQWDVSTKYGKPLGYDVMQDANHVLGRLQTREEDQLSQRVNNLFKDQLSVLRYI
nr:hypothetical protein [Nanoarchaeum sp.]